jgi:hypothetical protein
MVESRHKRATLAFGAEALERPGAERFAGLGNTSLDGAKRLALGGALAVLRALGAGPAGVEPRGVVG